MLQKVDLQEVALAAKEKARSATEDASSTAKFKRWSVPFFSGVEAYYRPALAAR
ncbi:MAG: hypothetical protein VB140_08895 [Burkholderia sp.]|nr:MAG: hypothetical protein E5299_01452 [Burkholderia gladioli]